MGAYTGVQNCFNRPLAEVAKLFHYSESNILVLNGDESKIKTNYPEVFNNLVSCKHHADARTPIQYGQDLVASWLFEDTFLAALRKSDRFRIVLDGADKKREILPSSKTSASSDYKIVYNNGSERQLELMCDYTGFWKRTGKMHLRDDKYEKLTKSFSLFVAVSVIDKEFILFDFNYPIPAKYISSHRFYGGKPAYEISIDSKTMKPYTSNILIDTISNIKGE